jgi:hypothetical protein
MPVNLGYHKIFTAEVHNFNAIGMCSQSWCSKKYTEYTAVVLNGLELYIPFCKAHASEFEKRGWEARYWGSNDSNISNNKKAGGFGCLIYI